MAEVWREAVGLGQEYAEHSGYEWPGFAARKLMKRATINGGVWSDWSLMREVDAVLANASFDVDDLAKNYLGVKLIIEDLSDLDRFKGSPVFGYASPGSWSISICQRAKRYFPLYRATVMHEVAHLLLHAVEKPRMLAYTPFASSRPTEEREADQFMHVSLLPRSVLLLACARYAASWQMNLKEVLRSANTNRGCWQWKNRILRPVIDRLAVSRQMICIKMKRMGFFSQETLDHHLSYPLPNRWKPEKDSSLRDPIERFLYRLI